MTDQFLRDLRGMKDHELVVTVSQSVPFCRFRRLESIAVTALNVRSNKFMASSRVTFHLEGSGHRRRAALRYEIGQGGSLEAQEVAGSEPVAFALEIPIFGDQVICERGN